MLTSYLYSYGLIAWGNARKQALRIIINANYHGQTDPLFKAILKLNDLLTSLFAVHI